ncbi:universal stress protein [Streptomyces cellostaticus]|uniref:universal stress protein n=1 Tax=Streptomyces cellostaticus TaxID=67285 RepID=UPI0020265A09|nr:universal stress protein [Streptomyces cellostaticus]
MTRTVTAGLDGSPESRAAVEWAAREALLRRLPLKIVNVRWPGAAEGTGGVPPEAAEGVRLRHPGVEVVTDQFTGDPADALTEAAAAAELMVLGSHGLGPVGGFLLGSVSLAVIARAERPVVLVRAGEQAADEHRPDPSGVPSAGAPFRPVVLGLDTGAPDDTLLEFAFDAAACRDTALRVVHGWNEPPGSVHPLGGDAGAHAAHARAQATVLTRLLSPWRQKFPDVEVIEASRCGSAARVLVGAARDAALVVVGRRVRTGPLGARVGHVTHAVLHHVEAPVAVVPHT